MKKKEKQIISPLSSFQILERIVVQSEEQLLDLANLLKSGKPLLLSFELIDVAQANRMIGFLSGVVYAMDGITYFTEPKTVLFGSAQNFADGTLRQFMKEYSM